MYVDTNNKTEYFIYIVTILRIVRSESQTPIHIYDILTYLLRVETSHYAYCVLYTYSIYNRKVFEFFKSLFFSNIFL